MKRNDPPPSPLPTLEGEKARAGTRNIVTGQKVTPEKVRLSKAFRKNMTPAERLLWGKLRANRLDSWHFRRQQIVDGFIVDFYCHRTGLIIEIDGPIHQHQLTADAEREAALKDRGLSVLKFNNDQILNAMPDAISEIRQFLANIRPTPQPHPKWEGERRSSRQDSPSLQGRGSGDGS